MPDGDIGVIYSKLNKLDNRITELESTRPFLKEMIERNIASNEKLGETLQEVQESMIKMNDKMDAQAEMIETMRKEFEEANKKTNDRIGKIDEKVAEIDNRSKFDMLGFFKKNFPWIVVIIGLGIAYASTFIKF